MTPFTALSRAYPGTGIMHVRVVLRSGAVIEGDALDGDDSRVVVDVKSGAALVEIATDDIVSVAVRESSRWRLWTFVAAALLVWPVFLAGLIELADVFPTLGAVVFIGLGALVLGSVVARTAVLAWASRVTARVAARWRTCYSAS